MRRLIAAAAASALLLLAGCAAVPAAKPTHTDALSGELTVFAAASLKASFDEIAADFEHEHPGVDILPIVYDGSSTLVTQLSEGAAADVFASADEKNMTKAKDAGLVAASTLFATNTLVIAVPKGNPAGVKTLADLAGAVDVVLCAVEVPCGAASQTLLKNAGVAVRPASYEQNVTAVLTKVAAGEADAGLVYATDVQGDAEVESIVPEGAADVVNRYPIAVLKDAENQDAAQAFADYVLGRAGQAVLRAHGFGAP